MPEDNTNSRNLIEYEPEIIIYLDQEQVDLVQKHQVIIDALRNTHLSTKEIYELYYDHKQKKYTISLKSVYRYLERLEKKGLVKVSGYRINENNRLNEKLYSRTANIFFKHRGGRTKDQEREKRKMMAQNLMVILEASQGEPIKNYTKFEKFVDEYIDLEQQYLKEIVGAVPADERLQEMYGKLHIDFLNSMNLLSSQLLILLRNPEMSRAIREIFTGVVNSTLDSD